MICLALGSIWRWTDDWDRLMDYIRGLDIDGVEITLATKEELYSFRISEENISWLRGLGYVSIHAPFRLVRDADGGSEVVRQLDCIDELCHRTGARNVIIHPDNLPEPSLLRRYTFSVSTENLPPRTGIDLIRLRRILKRYAGLGLCVDVSHAYLWSKDETQRLVSSFKERVSQVHVSGTYRKRDHQSLKMVTEEFLLSVEPVAGLGVPLVLEGDIRVRSIKVLRSEIKTLREVVGRR